MIGNLKKRNISRKRRVFRIRKKLKGTNLKPRMSVNRSNKHIFVQVIDDESANTIVAYGTYAKEFKNSKKSLKSKEVAQTVGKKIAQMAIDKNINEVVFDRGKNKFHGILSELANAARQAGLKF